MARAAGLVHPMDWVKVYESHTAYEWAMQRALAIVDPWGDARADRRIAVMAGSIAAVVTMAEDKAAVFTSIVNAVQKCFEIKLGEEELWPESATLSQPSPSTTPPGPKVSILPVVSSPDSRVASLQ